MNPPDRNTLIETMRRHKICVLVPTYNNGGTIRDVIAGILDFCADVIVVNDGSTDETECILESFNDSVNIITHSENKGKGHALRSGFMEAARLGYEYAITIDSDGQHYPEDIPSFVRTIVENPGALIIGERDLSNADINGKSSFANKFSNFWFHLQTGRRLKDTQTGFRAYPLRKLHGMSLLTSRYEAELELLVFASWHGTKIIPIPIAVYYPPQSERVSHFRPALDFTRISILNTILCFAAILYGIPARIYNSFTQHRIFNKEFRLFTRKRGEKLDAAVTLCRIFRSIYGFSFFTFMATAVFSPFASIYFLKGKNSDRKKLRFHKMVRWGCELTTRNYPGARTTYENPSNEDFNRPALVICNHQSHLDLPLLIAMHPKLVFLTNDWVWNSPVFGNIIHHADFLPVSEGIENIMPRLRKLKENGYSIVIFPEGTRSPDSRVMRFHQGAFLLAKELDLDILPLVLHGAGHFLPKGSFLFRKGKLTLRIMQRTGNRELEELPFRKQASYFRSLIKNEYERLLRKNEDAEYFRSLVLYKYAYRGWSIVSRCKKELKKAFDHADIINCRNFGKVRIMNGGIGVFPLLYALVNKDAEVFSYIEDAEDFRIASDTPALPSNLHFIHAVWNNEFGNEKDFDKTITL